MTQTLEQLSAAATEGEWISIQSSINPERHYITNEHHAIFASEIGGTKPADLKFVTSLVNAYRTGQLVEVQADDAMVLPSKLTPAMEEAGIEASDDHFIMDSITLAGLHKFYEAAASKAKAASNGYKQGYADGFAKAIDSAVEAVDVADGELLPCPFCGCSITLTTRTERDGYMGDRTFYVPSGKHTGLGGHCSGQDVRGSASVEAATTRWNIRTGQLVAVADDAIERVARALCDEAEYAWDKLPDMPDSVCGHSAPECCKYYWRRLAKAAIAAMKDTQP